MSQETKRVVEVDVTVNETMLQDMKTVGGDDVGVGLRQEMETPDANFSLLQTTAEIHSFGDQVSICYGDEKKTKTVFIVHHAHHKSLNGYNFIISHICFTFDM